MSWVELNWVTTHTTKCIKNGRFKYKLRKSNWVIAYTHTYIHVQHTEPRRSGIACFLYPHARIHTRTTANWADFPLKMVSNRPYVYAYVCVCTYECTIELSHSCSRPFWIQIVFHVVFSHGWLWSLYEASNSHIYLLYILHIYIVYILLFIFVVVIFFCSFSLHSILCVRLCVIMSVCFHSSGNQTHNNSYWEWNFWEFPPNFFSSFAFFVFLKEFLYDFLRTILFHEIEFFPLLKNKIRTISFLAW